MSSRLPAASTPDRRAVIGALPTPAGASPVAQPRLRGAGPTLALLTWALPVLVLAACTGDEKDDEQVDDEPTPDEQPKDTDDTGKDSGGEDGVDDGDGGDGGPTIAWDEAPPPSCAAMGLTTRAIGLGVGPAALDAPVPAFTLPLLDGETWDSARDHNGCDNLFFFNLSRSMPYPQLDNVGLLSRWLAEQPDNSQLFFMADLREADDREASLLSMKTLLSEATARMDDGAAWRARIHFVTEQDTALPVLGPIGAVNLPVWAIDRLGAAREVGYLCDALTGWETCPPSLLSYAARQFNFEADRAARLEAADAAGTLVLDLFDDQAVSDGGWAGVRSYATLELPDAAALEAYDTLELDLDMRCAGHPDLSSCPAWDYLVHLYLCEVDDPATADVDESTVCDIEFGRWITTYWRPGRWVHDVTPLLALIAEGGPRRFAFYSQQPYIIDLKLRLSDQDRGERPFAAVPMFTGGGFTDRYNWGQWRLWVGDDLRIGTTEADAYTLSAVELRSAGPLRDVVVQLGADHPYQPGTFGRVWEQDDPLGSGARYQCVIGGLATQDEAAALTRSCAEDDPATADVDESLGCVGADPADLLRGCGTGPWVRLEPTGAPMPDGAWAELWDASKLPQTFTPPPGTTKVTLAAVISGHGFADTPENCAEFCDHQHLFTVNEALTVTKDNLPWVNMREGCAEQVDVGVIANQAGTWPYGRGGWCPGLQVDVWEADLTPGVAMDGANTLAYYGQMDGAPWRPGVGTGARVDMRSWLIYYR
ncbi:MAG: hypothetical protein RL071_2974 [Pseudomonadota bacterium]